MTTPKIVATVLAVAALGALPATAPAAPNHIGGCPDWMCGSNHNEVMT